MNVTVVTVTYGKRARLLTQVLDAAREQGVVQAIVINNGSAEPIAEILSTRYGDWAKVVSLGSNLGSAAAFGAGFDIALRMHAEYILTLDDDNVLEAGSVLALSEAYREQAERHGKNIAVCGYRERFFMPLLPLLIAGKPRRRKSSFHGFHFADIPVRILNRLRKQKAAVTDISGKVFNLEFCPYGGLLIHRSTLKKIGFPNKEFFLYEDLEFTNRICRTGGHIFLVCDAKIADIDESWNKRADVAISFFSYLHTERTSLAYYSFRNACYNDFYIFPGNRALVFLNSLGFMILLFLYGLTSTHKGTFRNLSVFFRAYSDGLRKKLGFNLRFPIVQAI